VSIRKITNPQEYLKLLDNLEPLWEEENKTFAHSFKIEKSSLAQIATTQLLTWEYHVWSNEKLNSIIMFQRGWNILCGKIMFYEIIWLSKSGDGIKLLKMALDFARKEEYDLVVMGSLEKMPRKLNKLYKKLNLKKDGELWVGKL